ncbi:MAG TPA: PIN domain-containing protein [Candidatus Humimicrobiaceae bacterium]
MAGKKRVFLDASVFIAVAGSESGGSSIILEVCKGIKFSAVTSRRILLEAQKNIRKKLPSEALLHFYKEIANLSPEIIKPPAEKRLSQYNDIIAFKDRHVLVSALEGKATFLITLDRKHFQTEAIRKANLLITIMTPKEFLEFVKKYTEL